MEDFSNVIVKTDPKPYYIQISEWIRKKVLSNEWQPNYQLYSEEDLSKALNVSRGTVRKAISQLINEGILIQIHGKGTFVAEPNVSFPFAQELISFAETMARNNVDFETNVLEMKKIEPIEHLKSALSLKEDQKVLFLKRIRYIDGEPVILTENYVNLSLCPGLENIDFTTTPLFNAIESLSKKRISHGIRKLNAKSLDEEQAELLELPVGYPILFLTQTVYLNEMGPVEVSKIWIKSDKYDITSYLSRE